MSVKIPHDTSPNFLGVVPQSDLSSTIIVSRCYNDLEHFPTTDSLFHKKTLPYGHPRLRLKTYRNFYSQVPKFNATKTKCLHLLSC